MNVRDVPMWDIKATGARTVLEVDAYATAPLENFVLDHWPVEAKTVGHIADAKDWKMSDMSLAIADGSAVAVTDSSDVMGLPHTAVE